MKQWWNTNGQIWGEKFKSLILKYRNIGHEWQFNERQKKVLHPYYAAKYLLVDCLKSRSHVTSTVRERIESTFLLPMSEISNSLAAKIDSIPQVHLKLRQIGDSAILQVSEATATAKG